MIVAVGMVVVEAVAELACDNPLAAATDDAGRQKGRQQPT
jgi:hypothetical protein